jgi:hypothetical protein
MAVQDVVELYDSPVRIPPQYLLDLLTLQGKFPYMLAHSAKSHDVGVQRKEKEGGRDQEIGSQAGK